MSPRYHNVEKTPQILDKLMGRMRFRGRADVRMLANRWRELVGELIAEHSQPVKLQKNVLTLLVENATWMSELEFQRPVILEKIAGVIKGKKISDVRLVVGVLKKTGEKKLRRELEEDLPELSEEEQHTVEAVAMRIRNSAAREALRAAYTRTLRIRKKRAIQASCPPQLDEGEHHDP